MGKLPPFEGIPAAAHSVEDDLRAKLALETVDQLADQSAELSKSMELNYRKLFGARPREGYDKIVWRGIIGFANAARLTPQDITKFFWLLVFCTQSDISGSKGKESFLESFAEMKANANWMREMWDASDSRVPPLVIFCALCTLHQPQVRKFLTWLCAPQHHREFGAEALSLLGEYAAGVRVSLDFSEANFDESSTGDCPFYYWKSVQYQYLMSPIFKFMFDRIERYHDWLDRIEPVQGKKSKMYDDDEKKREEAVPIRICDRPGCGKFLVPERVGRKKFCSKVCCDLAQPRRSGERNRDYMRLYRLEQEPTAVLRVKLKTPARKKWLKEIEADWPELADRVVKLKQRASR